MTNKNHKSPLPMIKDISQLDFWQTLGVSAMLASCHTNYSEMTVLNLFDLISSSISDNRLVLFFNHENKPVFLAILSTLSNSLDDFSVSLSNIENAVLFENIVSPFSSPIHCYRFLKVYCQENSIPSEQAYLLDMQKNTLRKVW